MVNIQSLWEPSLTTQMSTERGQSLARSCQSAAPRAIAWLLGGACAIGC